MVIDDQHGWTLALIVPPILAHIVASPNRVSASRPGLRLRHSPMAAETAASSDSARPSDPVLSLKERARLRRQWNLGVPRC